MASRKGDSVRALLLLQTVPRAAEECRVHCESTVRTVRARTVDRVKGVARLPAEPKELGLLARGAGRVLAVCVVEDEAAVLVRGGERARLKSTTWLGCGLAHGAVVRSRRSGALTTQRRR
eukprot:3515897-Pleurochrysis_carterae.AAC.2